MVTSLISVESSYVLNDHPNSRVYRWLPPLFRHIEESVLRLSHTVVMICSSFYDDNDVIVVTVVDSMNTRYIRTCIYRVLGVFNPCWYT